VQKIITFFSILFINLLVSTSIRDFLLCLIGYFFFQKLFKVLEKMIILKKLSLYSTPSRLSEFVTSCPVLYDTAVRNQFSRKNFSSKPGQAFGLLL